ncbi:hypothetical protein [Bradyrhizobium sp. AZCC 1699]|uniref:hypothetical protein n=1 Tax=unclassified Bradyrhizobium TaxID=2631580 RepID=UPI003FA5A0B0
MPNDIEIEDRRKFLISCGRFAAVTPPAMTLLLSTSLTSTAIARSGHSGNHGRPEHSFFDNDPDPPGDKKVSDNKSPRDEQAGRGDGNHASLGGGAGGGGGGGGGGGSGANASRGGSSGGSRGGGGSSALHGGGEDDKWRRGSRPQ